MLGITTVHFVNQRRCQPGAGAAEGVADGDRAAVDVHLCFIEAQIADARDRLCRERFVQLEQVDVLDLQPGAVERLAHGVDRPDAHVCRIDTRRRARPDDRQRRQLDLSSTTNDDDVCLSGEENIDPLQLDTMKKNNLDCSLEGLSRQRKHFL
jgi:hypothetical protein